VTLAVSRRSIDFFKCEAVKQKVHYRRIVRALVAEYALRMG